MNALWFLSARYLYVIQHTPARLAGAAAFEVFDPGGPPDTFNGFLGKLRAIRLRIGQGRFFVPSYPPNVLAAQASACKYFFS